MVTARGPDLGTRAGELRDPDATLQEPVDLTARGAPPTPPPMPEHEDFTARGLDLAIRAGELRDLDATLLPSTGMHRAVKDCTNSAGGAPIPGYLSLKRGDSVRVMYKGSAPFDDAGWMYGCNGDVEGWFEASVVCVARDADGMPTF